MFSYFYKNQFPNCNIEMDKSENESFECILKHNSPRHTKNYDNFIKKIEEYLGGDCRAIIVNNEVLFNTYIDKPVREKVLDDCVRSEITNCIHRQIFANFINSEKNNTATIYMFPFNSAYTLNINYENKYSEDEKRFTVTFKNSQGYIDNFKKI